jgi:uncharacterized protein YjbI with pentapeptide repeats
VARRQSLTVTAEPAPGAPPEASDPHRGRRRRQASVGRKKGLLDRIRNRESLAGADLRFLWFVHWDLSGRDLRAANLRGTQLTGSDLSSCDLRDAVLEAANLSGACLRDARLDNAHLKGALVPGADFRGATGLTKATLGALHARGAIVSDGSGEREKP